MKKLIPMMVAALGLVSTFQLQAQTCTQFEIKLNKEVKSKNYQGAYPLLNQALVQCPTEKINFYNFGEIILENLADEATDDATKTKYAQELVDLIDKRLANFPNEKKTFWEGEKINFQLNYGLLDKTETYNAYKSLFGKIKGGDKISTSAIRNYYVTAIELMNEQKLDFDKVLEVYLETKEVTEDNIELRSEEIGAIVEKQDSMTQLNPKFKLSKREAQTLENSQAAKTQFLEMQEQLEPILESYTTCDNLAPMFVNKFEANKDSLTWLKTSYQQLALKDCYDQPIMEQLENQYIAVWKKENPQAEPTDPPNGRKGGGGMSSFGSAARKYKKGDYNGAIAGFKKAINEVSGSRKGDAAYYIALSYKKLGSLSNAVSWSKKAASYKKGWGAPYQLISTIFGSNANSCGTGQFQKLSAYWVAADYAKKACAVDSRSCSWGRKAAKSYEATAPSKELIFQQGKAVGQSVSVSCFGGASTRIR